MLRRFLTRELCFFLAGLKMVTPYLQSATHFSSYVEIAMESLLTQMAYSYIKEASNRYIITLYI